MRSFVRVSVCVIGLGIIPLGVRPSADGPAADFGLFVASQLRAHAMELFGFHHPLEASALGPFDGPSVDALELAGGLKATLVSSAVESAADQIALWPDDDHPTHLFVCDEETSNPAVQRVDLSQPSNANATTIVTGLVSCDPVRRTPWGTIIAGEEAGATGGLYEIVDPLHITSPIAVTDRAHGTIYGLRVAAAGSSNWGQGAEVGEGSWTLVNTAAPGVIDAAGNVILRNAQLLQKFTGYYRPEDLDVDPLAAERGVFRACWANTGRLSHAGGTSAENSAVYGEVMCLTEEPPSAALPTPPTGTIPHVTRFIAGSQQAGMFDNVAFQPHTGNLVVLEDGPTSIVRADGSSQPRGNDLWMCLPDGADDDTLSDGCVRFASLRDTSSEPTGFIFLGSGEAAFVHLQHRDVDAANHRGSLMLISGFKVNDKN